MRLSVVAVVVLAGCAADPSAPSDVVDPLVDGTYDLTWQLAGTQGAIDPDPMVSLRRFELTAEAIRMDSDGSCETCQLVMPIEARDERCATVAADPPRDQFQVCGEPSGGIVGAVHWAKPDGAQTWWFSGTPTARR